MPKYLPFIFVRLVILTWRVVNLRGVSAISSPQHRILKRCTREHQKVKFTLFCLEYEKATVSNTRVGHSHIFSLFLDTVAIFVEVVIIAVDQTDKALAVK
jgi:hypothetical protein